MKHSKRFTEASASVERNRQYPALEAVELVKTNGKAKFDESFDISITLNILAKHTIRDTFVLPHQSGKSKRVLVFAKAEMAQAAEGAGADYVGSDELIEKIKGGWYDFDVAIATPDMMKDLAKLGPYLGKRGLMPNPKTGTVTTDIAKAVAEFKKGRTEFRADKKGVINLSLGRVSLEADKLLENAKVLFGEILRRRPTDLKGDYIRNVTLTSTMGPGVRVDWKTLS
jgi:large subunit ribosomal protein L1